jgi:hypothetical protein
MRKVTAAYTHAPRNVDPADRAVRIVIGGVLLAAVTMLSSNWRWLGLVGILPLLTGLAGWCPFYAWLARD